MEQTADQRTPWMGYLPDYAPLANPYVPFQVDNPPRYHQDFALIRGTAFPGLDLPFKGMTNKHPLPQGPVSNLQQLSFLIVELSEYLDTHPDDYEALAVYQKYQQAYHDASAEFQKKYHPITHTQPSHGSKYCWIHDPWPWEYAANRRES